MKMKCLSLIQPWAALVMAGAKRFETRSWAAAYRGPLAVHASSRFPQLARELCRKEPFRTALARAGIEHASQMSLGKLLGKVDLVAIHKAEDLTAAQVTYEEKCFGDYRVGRRVC
jgi:activating signal cointegrator 1